MRKIEKKHSSVLNTEVGSLLVWLSQANQRIATKEGFQDTFHSSGKLSVRYNIGSVDSALSLKEEVDVLPTLFSYDPKRSLKMDFKPERWEPGSNSTDINPCEREGNLCDYQKKVLYHCMKGDRAEV